MYKRQGKVRVSVVATGVGELTSSMPKPLRSPVYEAISPSVNMDPVEDEISLDEELSTTADLEPDIKLEPSYMLDEDFVSRRVEHEPLPTPRATYEPEIPPFPQEAIEPQTVVKRPFGFFGRKKSIPVATTPPTQSPRSTGDLFDEPMDDELEIPAFLRRSSR